MDVPGSDVLISGHPTDVIGPAHLPGGGAQIRWAPEYRRPAAMLAVSGAVPGKDARANESEVRAVRTDGRADAGCTVIEGNSHTKEARTAKPVQPHLGG